MIWQMGRNTLAGDPFHFTFRGFRDFWTASLLLEGAVHKQYLSGEEKVIRGASLSVYSSTSRHTFTSVPPEHKIHSIWVIFSRPGVDPERIFPEREAPGAWFLPLGDCPIAGEIIQLFQEMLPSWQSHRPYERSLAENALERVFLLIAAERAKCGGWIDFRIKQAMRFMHQNMGMKLNIAQLAEVVNLSPSRFSHLFVETNSCTPMAYLDHIRMEEAKTRLVLEESSIADISAALGYDNQFYFSGRFRKRFGMSPLQFRKQQRLDHCNP